MSSQLIDKYRPRSTVYLLLGAGRCSSALSPFGRTHACTWCERPCCNSRWNSRRTLGRRRTRTRLHLVAGANQPDATRSDLKADSARWNSAFSHASPSLSSLVLGRLLLMCGLLRLSRRIDLAQRRDDLLGQPVRNPPTLRVRAQVF